MPGYNGAHAQQPGAIVSHTPVESADLTWMDGDQPFSTRFADVYFSRESGLDETRHVFLLHNQLADRWAALDAGAHFCIAETGFGTGLNFLAAWQFGLGLATLGYLRASRRLPALCQHRKIPAQPDRHAACAGYLARAGRLRQRTA